MDKSAAGERYWKAGQSGADCVADSDLELGLFLGVAVFKAPLGAIVLAC